jgi:putative oxidoreductase
VCVLRGRERPGTRFAAEVKGYFHRMGLVHRLGRSMLAPMFVTGGLDAIRHPESKEAKAEAITGPITESLGLADETQTLVRVNGGVQVVGGILLGLGVLTRTAAFALAASLIPTTLAGHRFWVETNPQARAAQRIQFLKNTAMLGGLVLVTTDRDA